METAQHTSTTQEQTALNTTIPNITIMVCYHNVASPLLANRSLHPIAVGAQNIAQNPRLNFVIYADKSSSGGIVYPAQHLYHLMKFCFHLIIDTQNSPKIRHFEPKSFVRLRVLRILSNILVTFAHSPKLQIPLHGKIRLIPALHFIVVKYPVTKHTIIV